MSGPAPGTMKDSSAFALRSTEMPRTATEMIRPPLCVSRIVRRERHWGQVSLAGGSEVSIDLWDPRLKVCVIPFAATSLAACECV